VTTYSDDDEWQVERVPYNIPGALVYYRNSEFTSSYSIMGGMGEEPSYGSKYQLLVVDMNPGRMSFTDGTYTYTLGTRATSYDAALTLKDTEAFTLSKVNTAYGVIDGPFTYASKPAVKTFDDYNGYYPGFYYRPSTDSLYYWNRADSAVIPAAGDYSVRVTDVDGAPYTDLYNATFPPSWLGSGNPGDDEVDYGVMINLVSQAADGSTGTLHFPTVTSQTTHTWKRDGGGYLLTYNTVVTNERPHTISPVEYTLLADQPLDFVSLSVSDTTATEAQSQLTPQNRPVTWKTFLITDMPANSTQTWTLKMKYNGSNPVEINNAIETGFGYGHTSSGSTAYHWSDFDVTDVIYAFHLPMISR
jgi:hypothetical protein